MNFLSDANIFGAVVVTIMMLAYVGEERSSRFTFLFALTCIGASAYGWISGTWPFGIIEALWAVFAFRKWHRLAGKKVVAG